LGFVPRTRALFRIDVQARQLDIANFRLLFHDDAMIGYAIRDEVHDCIPCGELFGADPQNEELLVRALERESQGGFLCLRLHLPSRGERLVRSPGLHDFTRRLSRLDGDLS
jgi:hypothetical protein